MIINLDLGETRLLAILLWWVKLESIEKWFFQAPRQIVRAEINCHGCVIDVHRRIRCSNPVTLVDNDAMRYLDRIELFRQLSCEIGGEHFV